MKIQGIGTNNDIYTRYTKVNKTALTESKIVKNEDTIEISELGKELSSFSIEDNNVDREAKIQELKEKIQNGTYEVDAKLTAKSMIDSMRRDNI
ncbi:flagellar biosynthesis anti-sigma factor FlgM [Clostridium sp. MSJ-8]|uniref:flagellar biosynthesis anti-sigma factor FlgM n=1 Tax=Clostridium sp. MSJ-8 TaxID=2841510 RepID=UPI001C0F2D67|nr:flagellar biosynthesis anti-sigma factor FlgM [Clostridium sp. MSJ-8]MBU5488445.1 flagellar biosynthesis anti-sigma factor FlgM [Clostridium sp. MSJ-8]